MNFIKLYKIHSRFKALKRQAKSKALDFAYKLLKFVIVNEF